ncbi:MAG: DUF1801 domain-containing protein [Acidimicrobiia bacterium]|jgi:uncharacterized protein YdhG (YjbR/CyaY superfamily)
MDVDEYLAGAPEPQKSTLNELRQTLREILPAATEVMSYGVPAFKVEGKAVAGYAYFKNHCSYFPHSGSVLLELADELQPHEWSKGTLKFPIDESLPRSLVARLVEVRLEQLGLR